nr:bypass of stop codon protein 6 [Quercus suber]
MEHPNGGTSTAVLEPVELTTVPPKQDALSLSSNRTRSTPALSLRSAQEDITADRNETLPSPTVATSDKLQSWNSPRINLYRLPATFWAFTVMGMNDGTYGAIIPYLESYYGLEYLVVSLIFLSPFVGYNLAAVLNNTVHLRLGQRGVAIIGPICHLIAYIIIAIHPPYPVLVIVFILAGLGNGLEDSAWNAWIGAMENANEVLGFLHGFYGLGATIAPLIATTMITKSGLPWYYWYYVMIGCGVIELGTSAHAFWSANGAAFREENPRTSDAAGSRLKEATLRLPAARVTWLAALFLLGYVGSEVALGGWIVTFMLRVRHGGDFASGMTATGFWLGVTLGRVILGFVTGRIGEKLAIAVSLNTDIRQARSKSTLITFAGKIYLPLSAGLQLLFWLVPQFYVSAVAVSLVGFFLGPMFPAAMVACTKLLPKHLHVSGIGFAAAFGGSGGAIFPFAVGAIAQSKGVQRTMSALMNSAGVSPEPKVQPSMFISSRLSIDINAAAQWQGKT